MKKLMPNKSDSCDANRLVGVLNSIDENVNMANALRTSLLFHVDHDTIGLVLAFYCYRH